MTRDQTTKPERSPDEFQSARQIYNARRRLFEKADRLLEEADQRVAKLVSSLEEEDASQQIELVPSSPESSTA